MSHSPSSSSSSSATAAVASFPTSARSPTVSTGPGQLPSSVLSASLRQSRGGLTLTTVSTLTRNSGIAPADNQPTIPQSKLTGSTARPLYSLATPTSLPGLSESSSPSPSTPTRTSPLNAVSVSPLLTNKRAAFLNKHMRSKSSHFPGMMTPPSATTQSHSPLSTITQNSTRANAPPLFRSTSLPTVPQYERLSDRKFVPTLGSPSSPSSSWKNNSSPIQQSSQDRITNFKMRERSPSRRTSSSSLFSTSPKTSFSSTNLYHQPPQAMLWANMDAFPPTTSPSLTSCSSCPSTPNSLRSRSPSISSLETIPDSPDAEAEALEAERLAEEARKISQQQQSAGMARSASSPGNGSDKGLRRRSHVGVDGLGGGLTAVNTSLGGLRLSGVSVGNSSGSPSISSSEEKRRKRWSVCGGEKRADLELETIWEDRVVAAQSPPQQCVGIIGGAGPSEYEYEQGNGFGEGEMI